MPAHCTPWRLRRPGHSRALQWRTAKACMPCSFERSDASSAASLRDRPFFSPCSPCFSAASSTELSAVNPCTKCSFVPSVKTAMRVPGFIFLREIENLPVHVRLILRRRIQAVEQQHIHGRARRSRRNIGDRSRRHGRHLRRGVRCCLVCRVLFKEIDGLRLAVFQYREIPLAQSRHRIAAGFRHDHVQHHVARRGLEKRCPLRAGLGWRRDMGWGCRMRLCRGGRVRSDFSAGAAAAFASVAATALGSVTVAGGFPLCAAVGAAFSATAVAGSGEFEDGSAWLAVVSACGAAFSAPTGGRFGTLARMRVVEPKR